MIAAPTWISEGVATAFGFVASLRRGPALHTRGVARAGTAQLSDAGRALSGAATCEAVVRFSRGGGLPARFPDVNGVAVRFLDADGPGEHRDLLLATAAPRPLHRILAPAVDFATDRYSTIASYRLRGRAVVLTAELCDDAGERVTLDDLRDDRPRELHLTAVGRGHADEHLAVIHLREPVDDADLRFRPSWTGTELTPIGPLNALRPPAYAASRREPRRPR